MKKLGKVTRGIVFLLLFTMLFVPNVNVFASNSVSVTNLDELQLNDKIEYNKTKR